MVEIRPNLGIWYFYISKFSPTMVEIAPDFRYFVRLHLRNFSHHGGKKTNFRHLVHSRLKNFSNHGGNKTNFRFLVHSQLKTSLNLVEKQNEFKYIRFTYIKKFLQTWKENQF